ncbi:LysR family transcriptional regulator, partial [Mycobacterium tuberculosis]
EAVAEAGSIRAAARGSALTQPAMTYAIRELEQSVGAQLLVRSAKGVVPTEIGQALLRRARLLSNEVRRAE